MDLDDAIKNCLEIAQGEAYGSRFLALVPGRDLMIELAKLLFELKGRRDADKLFLSSQEVVGGIESLELAKAIFSHDEWFAKQVEESHFSAPEIRVARIMMTLGQLMDMRKDDQDCFQCKTPMYEAGEKSFPVLDGRAKEGDICCPACGHIKRVEADYEQPDGIRAVGPGDGEVPS